MYNEGKQTYMGVTQLTMVPFQLIRALTQFTMGASQFSIGPTQSKMGVPMAAGKHAIVVTLFTMVLF